MRRRDIVTSPSAARREIVDAPMPRSSSAVRSMPFGAAFNSARLHAAERQPSGSAFSELRTRRRRNRRRGEIDRIVALRVSVATRAVGERPPTP